MLSEPFRVSGSEEIEDLLTVMRQHKITVALVTEPQSGRTIGLVTIEDFLEELVGEIWDEDDIYDEEFISLGGNRYLADAKLSVGDAMNRMDCILPDAKLAAKPLIAWVYETFGKFPEEEDSMRYGLVEVTVDKIENNRLTKVVLKLNTDALDSAKPVIADVKAVAIEE